jgi:hypothetical protein
MWPREGWFWSRSGHFVPSEQKKLNRRKISVEVDRVNLTTLKEMLDHVSGNVREQEAELPHNKVETEAVGDTWATVYCSDPCIMQSLRVKDLLETEVTLFVANNKDMTVLGAVLVDTVVEEPCIKPSSFSGMVADCGCPCLKEYDATSKRLARSGVVTLLYLNEYSLIMICKEA